MVGLAVIYETSSVPVCVFLRGALQSQVFSSGTKLYRGLCQRSVLPLFSLLMYFKKESSGQADENIIINDFLFTLRVTAISVANVKKHTEL